MQYKDITDIAKNIQESNVDILDNKNKVIDEELRSIEALKVVYKN